MIQKTDSIAELNRHLPHPWKIVSLDGSPTYAKARLQNMDTGKEKIAELNLNLDYRGPVSLMDELLNLIKGIIIAGSKK